MGPVSQVNNFEEIFHGPYKDPCGYDLIRPSREKNMEKLTVPL